MCNICLGSPRNEPHDCNQITVLFLAFVKARNCRWRITLNILYWMFVENAGNICRQFIKITSFFFRTSFLIITMLKKIYSKFTFNSNNYRNITFPLLIFKYHYCNNIFTNCKQIVEKSLTFFLKLRGRIYWFLLIIYVFFSSFYQFYVIF